MAERFWVVCGVAHALMLGVTLGIGWRWRRRVEQPLRTAAWLGYLGLHAALFGVAALCLAVAALPWVPGHSFTTLRLLCQFLFGEGILLTAWIAALHLRRPAIRARALLPGALSLALLGVYVHAYHFGPYDLRIARHAVDLSGGRAGARTFRIVQMADIQTHRIGPYEERALREMRRLDPDMLVFTGDYIAPRHDSPREKPSADFNALLRRLDFRPPLGWYVVGGDVEEDGDWEPLFAGLPVTCMRDSHARVTLPGGRSLAVTGLSNERSVGRDPAALAAVLKDAPAGDLRLVIGHRPDWVAAAREGERVDLALAGHTHGGQVVIPFYGPPITLSRLPRRYAGGLNDWQGTPLHVGRGVGMERGYAPAIRFLCPPEICVLEVRY